MKTPISICQQQQYTSLTNSILLTPTSHHQRTHSAQSTPKINNIPSQPYPQYLKVPSQKRLTLTCQGGNMTSGVRQGLQGLKKKGMDGRQLKQKFVSLQSSIILQASNGNKQKQEIKARMQQLQRYFSQKVHILKSCYQRNIQEQEKQIYELQYRVSNISKELQLKNTKILELETMIRDQREHQSLINHKMNEKIILRISDCDLKMRIITDYLQKSQEKNHQVYDQLSQGLIAYFGNKFNKLQQKSQVFVQKSLSHLTSIQMKMKMKQRQSLEQKSLKNLQLVDIKEKIREKSLGTRQSIESVQQEESCQNISLLQDQGISFCDDCFFYPNQTSENCQLLIDMFNRRGQALALWQDKDKYLHYCDSGSFLYNRKGERMKLIQSELGYLSQSNVLKLH